MPQKTTFFDIADYLTTEEDIKAYLDEALASGDSRLLATVIKVLKALGYSLHTAEVAEDMREAS